MAELVLKTAQLWASAWESRRRGVRKLEQALRLTQQWQKRTGRTMALEAQPVDAPSTSPRDRLEAMAQEILRSSGTRLWD